jgi:type I restriction enzyme M protein
VLRRLDCVLEPTKEKVLDQLKVCKKEKVDPDSFLKKVSRHQFYNTSKLDMRSLIGDQHNVAENLRSYIEDFSPPVRDIFVNFDFHTQIDRLAKAKLIYQVTEKFANIDLHPKVVVERPDGRHLRGAHPEVRRTLERDRREHFTPREVITLMVNLLFNEDDSALSKPGAVRTLYDPTAGTGGMLSVAEEHLLRHNPAARLAMAGQELNPESYAICKADMLIKGQEITSIVLGNTLSEDGLPGKKFDYMLSNPPFGVEWKKIEKEVRDEAERHGYNGRFGPGLPRVSDGSLLFLLHLLSKMRPAKDGGSRIGIVLNGSPLFTGGAGSGESEIRRHVLENDLVEAIIGLPTDMFYNTGISTYVWIGEQPEVQGAGREGPAHRCQRVLAEDAKEPRQQAPGAEPGPHRGHHQDLRQVQGGHPGWRAHLPDLQERRLRLPDNHRRAPRAGCEGQGGDRDEGEGQR